MSRTYRSPRPGAVYRDGAWHWCRRPNTAAERRAYYAATEQNVHVRARRKAALLPDEWDDVMVTVRARPNGAAAADRLVRWMSTRKLGQAQTETVTTLAQRTLAQHREAMRRLKHWLAEQA